MAISAVLDNSLPADSEQKVKDALTAAAAVNTQRGDVIAVTRMKMKTAELAQDQEKQALAADKSERQQRLLQMVLRNALSLAAAALIFASVMMALRQLRQQMSQLSHATEHQAPLHLTPSHSAPDATPAQPAPMAGPTLVLEGRERSHEDTPAPHSEAAPSQS